jgi:hypothetical protein
MRGVVMHGAGDVRIDERADPAILAPTDAINRVSAIWRRGVEPGKVFDLSLGLRDAAEGYKAVDERRAIKALLTF